MDTQTILNILVILGIVIGFLRWLFTRYLSYRDHTKELNIHLSGFSNNDLGELMEFGVVSVEAKEISVEKIVEICKSDVSQTIMKMSLATYQKMIRIEKVYKFIKFWEKIFIFISIIFLAVIIIPLLVFLHNWKITI